MARMRAGRAAGPTTTLVADGERAAGERARSRPCPLPLAANTRSTHSRGRPRSAAAGVAATESSRARAQVVEAARRVALRPARSARRPGTCPPTWSATSSVASSSQLVVDEVGLGQRDDAVADAEQLEDAQVLLALGLPALGGGDDEQAGVDAAHAGQHVAEEADVAGHVDEADRLARREHGVGEAEVDGEAAPLLLLEAVRVGAGEGERPATTCRGRRGRRWRRPSRAVTGRSASAVGQRGVVGRVDGAQVEDGAAVRDAGDDRRVGRPAARPCWSPSSATPNDGIVGAGQRAGARERLARLTTRAGARAERPSARRRRLGSTGMAGHPPERDGRRRRRGAGRRARTSCSAAEHEAAGPQGPGQRDGRRRRRRGRPARR